MSFIITTVIPVYNVEKYLNAAIESLAAQKFFREKVEVILIDDGSNDRSAQICDQYASEYENIMVFHIKNRGVSHARNYGISHARGEYIHFMDSDDILAADMYEIFSNVIEQESPDIIVGGVLRKNVGKGTEISIGPEETRTYRNNDISKMLYRVSTEDERWLLDYIWNKFFKKSLIDNILKFDESLSIGEDFNFNCQFMGNISSITLVSDIVYEYSIRSSGLVTAFHEKPWIGRNILCNAHIQLYSKWNCLPEERLCEIRRYEGMLAFAALRSINNKRCTLSRQGKETHVTEMLNCGQFENILFYLRENSQIKKRFFYHMLKNKNYVLVKALLLIDRMTRR